MSQVILAANKYDGKTLAEMKHLGDPLFDKQVSTITIRFENVKTYLLLNVIERIRGVDSKTDEDDMGVWVGERSKTIVIFLSCRIP